MIINKDVYPDVAVGTYTTVSNPVMDYDADAPLEHSIFYSGAISENVQFCDETNYTYNATAPNCQFSVTPKDIVKGDVFFLSRGFRFFNFNDAWEYRMDQTYNIVTEFDISKFYFDMDQLTCQVYDLSNPDGGHSIGSASNMSFDTYRSQTAEYKKTHLIRSVTCNYVYGDSTSFCKYKGVENYYDVNVSPMIRYKFNDKTTIYAPVILNAYGIPDWQGPLNLNTLTGSGNFPDANSDIYSNVYTYFGKWYNTFSPGGPAHLVTAANIGAVNNFTVHAANDQGQQVDNGYHIPDITGINTDKYMIPVFVWGNRWDKRIAPFFTDEFLMRYIASFGLRFKVGNTMYIGYMQQDGTCNGDYILESQLADSDSANRNITDFSGSNYDANKPYVPPTPPPGPYDDDDWHGASFSGVGVGGAGAFAKVYYMTSTELANLRSWMNSISVPEGFDPMQQIIGLSQVPVALSGDSPENVVFVNSSAVYDPGVTTRAVDTGVSTQQAMGNPISYYLGSVDIVRRMQERGEPYLDYDCQIELYLPLIGMFSLDTQAVMGRTIYAYAVLDPVSGTLAAYAYVTKDGQDLPIAYGSTTIGVDLPISAQQLSVSRAALKQANAQLGTSLLSSALSFVAMSSAGGKGSSAGAKTTTGSSGVSAAGFREAGSDYMKASQVGNVFGEFMNWGRTIRQLSYGNNTAIAGSFGGSTAQWAYPFTPYVKIIRPRYEKPSNYAHSQGVPCVQTKTVGSCTGFIQCIGVDVSGITGATDLELQAIQAALSNGIYAGGGS